jgi:hypothetical protein
MNEQEIKNPVENLQTSEKTENPAVATGEMENLFGNYKMEKLRSIDSTSETALHIGETKLTNATSVGYSPEQIAKFRAERGIDNLLANNQQQIGQLQAEAKTRIENLS